MGGSESCYFRRAIKSGTDDRAHYQDGDLVPYKPGAGIDPKPAAANDGTIINVRTVITSLPHTVFPTIPSFVTLPELFPS